MKIIDAYWEKRNLGVNCVELEVANNDTLAHFNISLCKLQAEYQIVKIPSGKTDMLLSAQDAGFRLIEMNIQLYKNIKECKLPTICQRYEPHINVKKADKRVVKIVLDKIRKGDMFVTDKVARDPFFSIEKAGNRYFHWAKDILEQGASFFITQYKNNDVGFVLNYTKDGKLYNAFLGGIFSEYANKGLGFLVVHGNVLSIIHQGGNKIITGVSSNNRPILKLFLEFGFDIFDMRYILIKHTR